MPKNGIEGEKYTRLEDLNCVKNDLFFGQSKIQESCLIEVSLLSSYQIEFFW